MITQSFTVIESILWLSTPVYQYHFPQRDFFCHTFETFGSHNILYSIAMSHQI